MIDEDRTMQLYGYTSDELSHGSGKFVVAVCDECGKYRVLRYQSYRDLCKSCGKRGARAHYFGKHLSKETKQKISDSLKGNNISTETRAKISKSLKRRFNELEAKGEHWHTWKGGVSTFRQLLMSTPTYKNWRKDVFERDDYTCQMCNVRGGKLEAHHIRPVRDHVNDLLMYDIDNGITLCKKCHGGIYGHECDYTQLFDEKRLNSMKT